jgi:hypothetical protein
MVINSVNVREVIKVDLKARCSVEVLRFTEIGTRLGCLLERRRRYQP